MAKLDGKVAIVTGAASGIGLAAAKTLAHHGAKIIVADLNTQGAEQVAADICASGGTALAVTVDVSQEPAIEAMVAITIENFGGLDILHNNAALVSPEVMSKDVDIVNMDVDIWDQTMAVNLRGIMLGCKHAIPHMLERGGGSIINMSSASGLGGDIARAAYGTSKAGVNGLTQYVATMYGKQGIRCNAIAPGAIETPSLLNNISAQQRQAYTAHHLTPRLGLPDDIASAVAFLASDESLFITGQIISVDGGLMSHHPSFAEFSVDSTD
jgi:NAD(P)-dependent dehydrogenase (short-subunit alcohol dehydrogenase family)